MNTQTESQLDFSVLMERMQTAQRAAGQNRPAIVGGRFTHEQLEDFLSIWRTQWDQMPWRVWEQVSAIDFGFANEPVAPDLLQRADIFGTDGHLSLRRDGDGWRWHFIGMARPALSEEFELSDFWDKYPTTTLRRYADKVILWGQEVRTDKDDPQTSRGIWQDDRVGAAQLKYPQMKGISRAFLHYWHYTEAGQTAFVWYRGLGDEQEVKPLANKGVRQQPHWSLQKLLGRKE